MDWTRAYALFSFVLLLGVLIEKSPILGYPRKSIQRGAPAPGAGSETKIRNRYSFILPNPLERPGLTATSVQGRAVRPWPRGQREWMSKVRSDQRALDQLVWPSDRQSHLCGTAGKQASLMTGSTGTEEICLRAWSNPSNYFLEITQHGGSSALRISPAGVTKREMIGTRPSTPSPCTLPCAPLLLSYSKTMGAWVHFSWMACVMRRGEILGTHGCGTGWV